MAIIKEMKTTVRYITEGATKTAYTSGLAEPSLSEFLEFIKNTKCKEVRYITTNNKKMFMWDSYDHTHWAVVKGEQLEQNWTTQGYIARLEFKYPHEFQIDSILIAEGNAKIAKKMLVKNFKLFKESSKRTDFKWIIRQ